MKAFEAAAGTPWAIRRETLQLILEVAARENELDPVALSAKLGRPLDNTHAVTFRDGTAIIPIDGPIFPKANLFTEISGATSTDVLAQDLRAALDDPAVGSIVLEIDSPGGVVAGIGELAGMIREADAKKPVIAYVGDDAGSGAYWLASAAREIVVAPTARLGSIGVIMAARDPAKANSKTIEFVSSQSPHKRPDPTTERGKAQYQAQVDSLADVFVADVARFRNTTSEKVISDFGAGGLLVGAAAVKAGMADRLGTFEGVLDDLRSGRIFSREKIASKTPSRASASISNKEPQMSFAKKVAQWFAMGQPDQFDESAAGQSQGTFREPPPPAPLPKDVPPKESPELVALKAEVDSLRKARSAERTRAIQEAAATFAETTIRAGRAMPYERAAIVSLYTQAALDDAAQLDAGTTPAVAYMALSDKGEQVAIQGSRTDAIKASFGGRPSHGMFSERTTSDHLPPGFHVQGNGTAGNSDKALDEATAKFAAARNGRKVAS